MFCSRTGRRPGEVQLFEAPEELIVAREPGEAREAFARMEAASERGLYLAGYASYELGYALEPKFSTQTTPRSRTPLLLFGAFRAPGSATLAPADMAAPRNRADAGLVGERIRRAVPRLPRLYFRRRRLSDQSDIPA